MILRWVLISIFVGTPFLADAALHLTLREALIMASQKHVAVLVAAQNVQQALARMSQQRSSLLPDITATAAEMRRTEDLRSTGIRVPGIGPHIGPFNTFDMRLHLTQSIFDPEAMRRLDAVHAGKNFSEAEWRKAKEDALALVAALYIEARRSAQAILYEQYILEYDKKVFEVERQRLTQGTGSSLKIKQARAQYLKSRYLLKASVGRARQARLDLAAALNLPQDQPIIFDDSRVVFKIDKTGHPKINPDVDYAQMRLSAAQGDLVAAKGAFWPKISALADYGRSGESPRAASNTYSLGVQASLPIFQGGRQARVKETESKKAQAQLLLDDTNRQTTAKIDGAKRSIREARMLVVAAFAQARTAKEELTAAKQRLDLGLASPLSYTQAVVQDALAQDELDEARAAQETAYVNLAHLLGRMEDL